MASPSLNRQMMCSVCKQASLNFAPSERHALPAERRCLKCAPETARDAGNCPARTVQLKGPAGGAPNTLATQGRGVAADRADGSVEWRTSPARQARVKREGSETSPSRRGDGEVSPRRFAKDFVPGEPIGTSPVRRRASPHRDSDRPAGVITKPFRFHDGLGA